MGEKISADELRQGQVVSCQIHSRNLSSKEDIFAEKFGTLIFVIHFLKLVAVFIPKKLKRMAEPRAKIEFQIKKEQFEAIADNAVCSKCKVVPRKGPIYQSRLNIEDILCEECYDYETNEVIEFVQSPTLEKMLYAFQVTSCKFRKNGCKVIQDLKNIEYHEEDCEFRDILCPYFYCKDIISFNALKEHFRQTSHLDFDDDSKSHIIEVGNKIVKLLKANNVIDDHAEDNEDDEDEDNDEIDVDENEEDVDDDDENSRTFYVYKKYEKFFIFHIEYSSQPKHNSVIVWVQLYGSKFEAKNYNFTVKMGDSTHGECMFKGAVKSLDDDKNEAFAKPFGLILSPEFVKKFIDDEGSLTVEIEIENLKPQEEQADYEEPMEADVATTANDDKEKDSKN